MRTGTKRRQAGGSVAILKAVVSDKDGIIHELVLEKKEPGRGYRWYYGNVALVATQAATPEEALSILREELAPSPGSLNVISIIRDHDPGS